MAELTSSSLLGSVFSKLSQSELKHYVSRSALFFSQLDGPEHSAGEGERCLDPLPLVLSTDDRLFLERGLVEWAHALESSYRRLRTGSDFCCSDDIDEILWRDAAFDPALNHLLSPQRDPLGLIRFDLVRDRRQGYRVLSIGTGSPRGLGLALETRVLHGRVFTPILNRSKVLRLAPFFRSLKQDWYARALHHLDEPSVMLWSPGPSDPDYAEYVYLCRYFGFPLVESRDLSVRSGKVFLKMLGGLRPVDVLIRTVGDRNIDPLSGNPPPFDGVAGLAQALRDGEVFVSNAPGSDILEHPALLFPLAALAESSMGRTLSIRPLESGFDPGTEPFWVDGAWQDTPYCLSLFAAKIGSEWQCMPGGLARVLRHEQGGRMHIDPRVNKDVWCLSGASVPFETLLPQRERPSLISRSADLPSRVADDLFWLGRYAERAWVDVRFLGKWLEVSSEEGGDPVFQRQAKVLERFISQMEVSPSRNQSEAGSPWRLWSTLKDLEAIASRVRDRFSMETHRVIGELAALVPAKRGSHRSLRESLDSASLLLAAFNGLANEHMTRGAGWRFLDMGKRIERAKLLTEAVSTFCTQNPGPDELGLLLELFDSLITYRNRYYFAAELGPVLDLLMLDESNPRSVAFQVLQLQDHLEKIPHNPNQAYRRDGERNVLKLLTAIRLAEGPQLAQISGRQSKSALNLFLAEVLEELNEVSDAVHRSYLAKIEELQRLQALNSGETH